MIHEIDVEGLAKLTNPVFIDVRSESEFAEATIPGAVNLPLFSDDERAEIGTVYKNVSPGVAKDLGLSLASPKLPAMVKRCRELATKGELVVFCWRGGMRSKSVAIILDLMGVKIHRLAGGYKAYRRSIVKFWEQTPFPWQVVVIRGNTGTGKTELIQELIKRGHAAVDLESLANNRGSVFGAVGLGTAPTQKNFEAVLATQIQALKERKWILVECESKRIGRVMLPNTLHQAMQEGTQVLVYDSVANRVERLVKEYTTFSDPRPELEAALDRLVKRLGAAKLQGLKGMLAEGDFHTFARILLEEYYDPLYGYPNQPDADYYQSISMEQPLEAVQRIAQLLDSLEEESAH